MKMIYFFIILMFGLFSCVVFKKKPSNRLSAINPPLTNTQQTAHIYALEAAVDSLRNSSVFLDSNFYKINQDGTFTFKSKIKFDTVIVLRMYIGVPTDTISVPVIDTLIHAPD